MDQVPVNIVSEGDESIDSPSPSLYADTCNVTSCPAFADPEFIRRNSPYQLDVLCGRGRGFYTHPGNRRMLDIVETFKEDYRAARKLDKCKIAKRVLEVVLLGYQEPGGAPRGRQHQVQKPLKFWRRAEEGNRLYIFGLSQAQWIELSEFEAQKKVAHTLRETRPALASHCGRRCKKTTRGTTRRRGKTPLKSPSRSTNKKKTAPNSTNTIAALTKKTSLTLRATKSGKNKKEMISESPVSSSSSSGITIIPAVPHEDIPPQVLAELDELDIDLLAGRYHEVDIYGSAPPVALLVGCDDDDISVLEWETV